MNFLRFSQRGSRTLGFQRWVNHQTMKNIALQQKFSFSTTIVPMPKPTAHFIDPVRTAERVMTLVRNFEQVDTTKVNETSTFAEVGLDSLDCVEVVLALEEEFAIFIPDTEAERILSVQDAVYFLTAHPRAK